MRPTTTISEAWSHLMRVLFQKSCDNEFLRTLGVPLLFTPAAPFLWAVAILIVAICGFAGYLEGGAQ